MRLEFNSFSRVKAPSRVITNCTSLHTGEITLSIFNVIRQLLRRPSVILGSAQQFPGGAETPPKERRMGSSSKTPTCVVHIRRLNRGIDLHHAVVLSPPVFFATLSSFASQTGLDST